MGLAIMENHNGRPRRTGRIAPKLTAVCIVDRTGKIEREGVVASDPETITAFIKPDGTACRADRA